MAEFLVGLFLGIVLGWITLWCYQSVDVGRFIGRILVTLVRALAVVLIALGLGLITWGVLTRVLNENMRSIYLGGSWSIQSPGEALSYGGGCLIAGVAALVLSFLRRRHKEHAAISKT